MVARDAVLLELLDGLEMLQQCCLLFSRQLRKVMRGCGMGIHHPIGGHITETNGEWHILTTGTRCGNSLPSTRTHQPPRTVPWGCGIDHGDTSRMPPSAVGDVRRGRTTHPKLVSPALALVGRAGAAPMPSGNGNPRGHVSLEDNCLQPRPLDTESIPTLLEVVSATKIPHGHCYSLRLIQTEQQVPGFLHRAALWQLHRQLTQVRMVLLLDCSHFHSCH